MAGLQATVGKPIHYLRHSKSQAFIGDRQPIEIQKLEDGRTLHIYDYWAGTRMKREGKCLVYMYFSDGDMIVQDADAEGDGCYTAY